MPVADTVSTYKSSFSMVNGKLKVARKYTQEGVDPYSQVDWVVGTAKISSADGQVVFEQQGVEFPSTWSQTAINIVASKYFYGKLGTPEREYSLKQLISRVVSWYARQGCLQGYFAHEMQVRDDGRAFEDELTYILLHQIASFNSPVWFNVGIQENPQVSACFINSVEDTMESIIDLQVTENRIFKGGSGAGSNLSKLRASTEFITGGGKSSGPVSFMKGYDSWASVTKSGGKNRRAAKIQILDVDHPDIMDFIRCKIEEEKKAKALIDAGYDASVGGEAYDSVFFQNSNLSIRVTDKFMQAVADDAEWVTTNRKDSSPSKTYKAREILREAARCAWLCGDPGMQYHDTINKWHTMPKDGEQVGTNPCQPGWATVLTPDGIRTFDQIDVGSTLWSGQQWTKVTRKVSTGVKPVFAYRTMRGTFYGTENHKVMQFNQRIRAKLATSIDVARGPLDSGDSPDQTCTVLSVDSMGDIQVFDITVDAPEHTYWTDGLLVSNCSEYTWLDDTSCNLASLNLLKFRNLDSSFRIDEFTHATEIMFVAQDISVSVAGYPTEKIARETKKYRTIGLGYTNLGAYLMASGLPYDSNKGRAVAAAITSLMTARAAATSGLLARVLSPLETYDANGRDFANVIDQHAACSLRIKNSGVPDFVYDILGAARSSWERAKESAVGGGFRNAQFTLLAPTGCISSDTLVSTPRGLRRIDSFGDVGGNKWQDVTDEVLDADGTKKVNKFFVNGIVPTKRIKTRRGFELEGTPNHRIRVISDSGDIVWKRLDEIVDNDLIPLVQSNLCGDRQEVINPICEQHPNSIELTVPSVITDDLSEIIGMYMANGYTKNRGGLHIIVNKARPELINYVKDKISSIFGLHPRVEDRVGCVAINACSRDLVRVFEANGWDKPKGNEGEGAVGAFIPINILASGPQAVSSFLRGLFEMDGCVSGLKGESKWVAVSTVSELLAKQVQVSLLGLGIACNRRSIKKGAGSFGDRPVYEVRTKNAAESIKFRNQVGLLSADKMSKLNAVKIGKQLHENSIKHPGLVRAFANKAREISSRLYNDIVVRETSIARTYVKDLGHQYPGLKDTMLYALATSSFEFDNVRSVADSQTLTLDISVPGSNSYISNGFISHNTIGLAMDCVTTGVEPELGLTKYKNLVGGGVIKTVNQIVSVALGSLGYSDEDCKTITEYVEKHGTVEGAPGIRPEHVPVFDCSFKSPEGTRSIDPSGHTKMMAAVQPFLSGAISKTVNIPENATVEDIEKVYIDAHKMGIKCLAVYRDGCKGSQPLDFGKKETKEAMSKQEQVDVQKPLRHKLPDERNSITHKFTVGGFEGYITVGLYEDGSPGEVFVTASKEGSTVSGLMDALATMMSLSLQYGVPLEAIVTKLSHSRFEPSGFTENPKIRMASSIVDYLVRWLSLKFLLNPKSDASVVESDAPPCANCGSITVRAGTCYKCNNCGDTTGCG